jgi:predicted amidohydrolase
MTVIATAAFAGGYDVDLNTKHHLEVMDQAAAGGAELLVFPEISLQGYPPDFARFYPERIRAAFDAAESVPNGPHVQIISERARDLGIYVIFGMHETGTSPGVIYNTAVLTGPEGFVGTYRKVHVGVTEQLTWRKGNDWPVFETAFGRIGMLICYDKQWPEATRELTLRGADILVNPTAWCMAIGGEDPATNIFVEQYLLFDRVRAVENHRWFVSSNFAGELGGERYIGLSQIVDPCGRVVATSGTLRPGLAMIDIDIRAGIAEANAVQGANLVRDRRPDTYLALNGEIPPAIDG